MKKPKIAFVLSGGSALGFAHLGVLQELLDNGIVPDMVVGTSMGAVVGGGYVCGLTIDEMINFAHKMNVGKFVDLNFKPLGIFGGKRITNLLQQVYGDKTDEDTICQFACVAADVITGEQVVLSRGKILDMVRASMNIPGLLVPIEYDGKLLVDGGCVNNLPDDIARDMGADIVISIDVLSNSYCCKKPKNTVDTLFTCLNMLQNTISKYKPNNSDIIIAPALNKIGQNDFKNESTDYAIEVGKEECHKHIAQIKDIIAHYKKNKKAKSK